jgi:hypothetical protein
VVTEEFLEHQQRIGNDLITPAPQYGFPGLVPGGRWCVTAVNWLRAHEDGAAAYVVLASTHERALEVVPLAALQQHAVDVPADPGSLRGLRQETSGGGYDQRVGCGLHEERYRGEAKPAVRCRRETTARSLTRLLRTE